MKREGNVNIVSNRKYLVGPEGFGTTGRAEFGSKEPFANNRFVLDENVTL